jgi:hypothetical protein
MQISEPAPESSPAIPVTSIHWPSVWQFSLSLLAILGLWGMAFSLVLLVFTSLITGVSEDNLSLMLTAAGLGTSGALLIPSAGYALMRILGRSSPVHFHTRHAGWWIVALPPVVVLGHFIARAGAISWLVLPPFHVFAVGLSVFWLLFIGKRGLTLGKPQRTWGVFGAGLVLAPLFSLIAEMSLILISALLLGVSLTRDPVLMEKLLELSDQIPSLLDPSEAIIELLQPALMQPWIIYAGLVGGAVLVPLIEELFKPIGVWFLLGCDLTPTQGFVAGLLSGAGYALFESFTLSAGAAGDWGLIVTARLGTSLIHIITTGLSGWALALAWRDRRYLRLGLTYLLAVAIHAIWNGLVILNAVPGVVPEDLAYPEILKQVGFIAPWGLIFLMIAAFILLLSSNIVLRRAIIPPATLQPARLRPNSVGPNLNDKEDPANGNHQLSD